MLKDKTVYNGFTFDNMLTFKTGLRTCTVDTLGIGPPTISRHVNFVMYYLSVSVSLSPFNSENSHSD